MHTTRLLYFPSPHCHPSHSRLVQTTHLRLYINYCFHMCQQTYSITIIVSRIVTLIGTECRAGNKGWPENHTHACRLCVDQSHMISKPMTTLKQRLSNLSICQQGQQKHVTSAKHTHAHRGNCNSSRQSIYRTSRLLLLLVIDDDDVIHLSTHHISSTNTIQYPLFHTFNK